MDVASSLGAGEWSASCTGSYTTRGKSLPVTIRLEAAGSELVWTRWRRERIQ